MTRRLGSEAGASFGRLGRFAEHIDRVLAGVPDVQQLPTIGEQQIDSARILVGGDGNLFQFGKRASSRGIGGDSDCIHKSNGQPRERIVPVARPVGQALYTRRATAVHSTLKTDAVQIFTASNFSYNVQKN